MPILNAFVARSFKPEDTEKVNPILRFLDSFETIGLRWKTAERAEVESVSEKVCRLIDESDIFVGILTARHAVYTIGGGFRQAYKVLRRKLRPDMSTAPPWILQELGYALKGMKKPILFLEAGVEVPGLQGDLEYINYDWNNTGPAFQRANEMLLDLVGKQAGLKVETVLRVAPASAMHEHLQPKEAQGEDHAIEGESGADSFRTMIEALDAQRFSEAEIAYEQVMKRVKEQKPEGVVRLEAVYNWRRYKGGFSEGLDNLRRLQQANPTVSIIPALIGDCLSEFGEPEQAAREFKRAASLATGDKKICYTISATDCLKKIKKYEEAVRFLVQALNADGQTKNAKLLRALHNVLQDADRAYEAFGIAELLLRENPGQGDFRFDVGLKYQQRKLSDLFLYHFKLIGENDSQNGPAIHNLALACADCGLTILSVSHYKQAFNLGVMLSASNLGYTYLKCGMADEAEALLNQALKKTDCGAKVPECLASVRRAREEQAQSQEAKVEGTKVHRDFFVSLGEGFLSIDTPRLDGMWDFPEFQILLTLSEGEVTGKGEKITQIQKSVFQNILFGIGRPPGLRGVEEASMKVEHFRFSGVLAGRVCKFRIERSEATVASTALGPIPRPSSTFEGYIVFSHGGECGDVVEFKDGKPDKYYSILNTAPPPTPPPGGSVPSRV
jgi:tetratricopeptide (TPR) repeat protein